MSLIYTTDCHAVSVAIVEACGRLPCSQYHNHNSALRNEHRTANIM